MAKNLEPIKADYDFFLEMIKSNKFQKIRIEGGQTEGHILFPDSPPSSRKILKPRKELGRTYAKKYQEEDEMEDILLKKFEKTTMNEVSGVDDITSIGTVPNLADILGEQMTQIYDTYSFVHEIDPQLLIHTYKDEIMEEIEQNSVIIIKGQTGCGKTTQVPQYILDSCRSNNVHCNIVVTQPRRIAAISIAKRVCQERNWDLGSIVGYQVALERQLSDDTRLLYCTAGVLLQMLIGKQNLSNYTHIIIDEIHERDNETDFLLIIIKKFLRIPGNRAKVILMSATMNVDKFINYFTKRVNGVNIEPPVIELQNKTKFAVQYFYLDSLVDRIPITMPLLKLSDPRIDRNAYELAAILVEVFHTIDAHEHNAIPFIGSVLIFLPGIHEIEVMFETLEKRKAKSKLDENWILCPLHSTVTNDEQSKVFKTPPPGYRKIILATNIAESSITVPDVKYVIDFCLMKMQVQEIDTSYSSLQLSWASKSQATQRAGRVGRVMPGRVYRLVSESLFGKFLDDCVPEILRCPLDTLLLKAKELDIGPPAAVLGRAMDPPDLSNIQANILSLKEKGALLITTNGTYDEFDGDLTFIGKVMASLPIDPYLSKLIILGHMFSCLDECVIMASAMSVKSIFSSPFKQQLEAYNSKIRWDNYSCSDPIAYLSAYKLWRYKVTTGQFRRTGGTNEEAWAAKYFVQIKSLKEVARLEGEILNRLRKLNIQPIVGANKIQWEDHELPLILKIVLAGAFYPNYFIRNQINEKDAVKVLGGRDPFTTVYLSNFPTGQPGPLYVDVIKQHFHHCGSHLQVTFDGSSKVYLTFGSSYKTSDDKRTTSMRAPGTISMAVYRAIKMRHLQIPITISLLPIAEADRRAKEIFGDTLTPNVICWQRKRIKPLNRSMLPGLSTSLLPIVITHINSPGHFFCHINDEAMSNRHVWLNMQLNGQGCLVPLSKDKWKVGVKCVASYTEQNNTAFYRASVLAVNLITKKAQIIYMDYGNEAEANLNQLMDYCDNLVQIGVRDEPPLAIECTLAEIQPSPRLNPKGYWSKESTNVFKTCFENKCAVALIYSLVNSIMTVTLFEDEENGTVKDLSYEHSFNNAFIKKGYAELSEEPYLSRENHVLREMAQISPEEAEEYNSPNLTENLYPQFKFEPPSEKECYTKVQLKGPKSPLEMTIYSLTKKSQGKEAIIEWNSVNSVLLDTIPMDSHDRMVVAANVTQSSKGDRLTLRNTTFLPNMHGLPALILMIFGPKIELRTDPDREMITGAICGLGYDPNSGESYYPENDIEMMFDTKFDLDDLESINKLRFWMNFIVGGWEGPESDDISIPRIIKSQHRIRDYLLKLISKTRTSIAQTLFDNSFAWDQLPQEILLDPLGPKSVISPTIYPLIWGVELSTETKVSKIEAIKTHLKQLRLYCDGGDIMRVGTKCELCQVYIDDVQGLRLHLQTNLHKTNLTQFDGLI